MRQRSDQEWARAYRWYDRIVACEVPDTHILDAFVLWLRRQPEVAAAEITDATRGLLFELWRERYLDWFWYENLSEVMPRTPEQWVKARGASFGINSMEEYRALLAE